MKPEFRIYPGYLRGSPVLWLEQTGGFQVMPYPLALASVERAVSQARDLSHRYGCVVAVEQSQHAVETFDFAPVHSR